MPDAAVASSADRDSSSRGGRVSEADLEAQVAALGGPVGRRPRLRVGWTQVAFVGLLAVVLWLVFVFGSTLQQLNEAKAKEDAIKAETAALQVRLDEDRRERQLVQTDAFQQLQARAYGLGAPNERVFSLEPGAPSPAPLPELGTAPVEQAPEKPLEAWLNLLLGN